MGASGAFACAFCLARPAAEGSAREPSGAGDRLRGHADRGSEPGYLLRCAPDRGCSRRRACAADGARQPAGDLPPAPVLVYTNRTEGSRRIYGEEILSWSRDILARLPPEPTDEDLKAATEELYQKVMAGEAWQQELRSGQETLKDLQCTLGCYTIDLADETLRERFTTRRGMVSVEVLPERFEEEADELRKRGEKWRLLELLVPVPLWWLKVPRLGSYFSPEPLLGVVKTSLPYDDERGLSLPSDKPEDALIF